MAGGMHFEFQQLIGAHVCGLFYCATCSLRTTFIGCLINEY
jgi:hypothetical protein